MVAVVAGNGLGLFNASLNALGGGISGQSGLGQSGGQALVNASNGNLVLRFTDEQLSGFGQDLFHTRTYNTQGALTDGDADGWRWEGERKVVLNGVLNTAGSSVVRTTGDGHEAVYTWNGSRYQSTEGDGAHDSLTWSAGTSEWLWTDGSSLTVERYDGASGRLKSVTDAQGTQIAYSYDANGRLSSVKDLASGQELVLSYNAAGKLQRLDTRTTVGGALTQQVYYGYDAAGRLTSVTTDLTPADNSIADGNVYTTTYAYDGASFRIASVSQSDGTTASFSYELVGADYRIKTVTDASGVTTFTYDTVNRRTDISNGLGQQWSYFYDTQDRLIEVQTPAVNGQRLSTRYAYDVDGNVTRVTDGRGNALTYQYDVNGNRILERDALGNTIARTYNAANQVLSEIRYSAAATWNSATSTWTEPPASTAQVTRYAYDSDNRLRYTIDADGHVVEYRYNASGLLVQQASYADTAYTVAGLAPDAVITEAALTSWVAGRDKTRSSLTELTYDYRGNLTGRTVYASVDATGSGVLDAAAVVTKYIYSEVGQLLQTIAVRGSDRTGTSVLSSMVYDGMGRVLSQTDASGTRTNAYDGANRKVSVTNSAGLTTTQTYDAQGRLVNVTQVAVGVPSRTTQYVYDAAGRRTMVQDATGVRTYTFYDEAGRVSAQVDGTGAVIEYVYNEAGQRTQEKHYATLVTTADWYNGTSVIKTLVSQFRPAATPADRTTRYAYDNAGRLSSSTDPAGTITTYAYDGRGQLIKQQTGDRITRYFYDASGRQIGQLDGEGYLRESIYDAAGRLQQTIRYGAVTATANQANGTLVQLRPTTGSNLSTWYFYDDAGRQIGSVDEQQFVTEVLYDEATNLQQTLRYATAYTAAITASTAFATIKAAVSAGAKQTTTTAFDAMGRVGQRTATDGTITAYEYDAAGRLVREIHAQGTIEERSTRTLYDAFDQTVGQLLGEASARITVGMTDAQVAAIYAQYGLTYSYDAAGRVASATDAAGNRTLSYYDADGRLTHVINALGEVSETVYSAFGEVSERTEFTTRLAANDTAALTGGLLTTPVKTLVQAIRNAAVDNRRTYAYDTRGLLTSSTDALGFATSYDYNVFGEQTSITRTISSGIAVTDSLSYNKRGEVIGSIEDVGGLARSTATVYDAFGQVIRRTDGRGFVSTTAYTNSGRTITSTNALGQSQSTAYDAFGRVLTSTDALGKITSYAYNDITRTITVTTPDGVSVNTVKNRHGETLTFTDGNGKTTTYSYNKDGQLLISSDALNQTTTNAYDNAGRLLSVTDALGRITRYGYDAASRVITRTDANNTITRYTFDGQGRQVRVTEAEGKTEQRITDYAYDRSGQVLTVTQDPAGLKLTTTYTYDGVGQQVQVARGTTVSPSQQVILYVYDKLGRRTAERQDPDGLNLTTQYRYNGNDQVTRKIDPVGKSTWYVYDNAGRLTDTVDALGGVTRNIYDANGHVVRTTRYATALVASVVTAFGDAPTDIAVASNIGKDQTTSYVYDNVGRLTYTIDASGAVTQTLYDATGKVVGTRQYAQKVQLPTVGSSDGQTLILSGDTKALYGYQSIPIDPAKTYTVRAKLRQLSGTGSVYVGVRSYDESGNVVHHTSTATYSYSAAINVFLTPEMGWQTFEGNISGTVALNTYAADKFIAGSVTAVPLLLYNYYGDVSGDSGRLVELDSLEFIDTATGQVLNENAQTQSGVSNWFLGNAADLSAISANSPLSVEQIAALLHPASANDRITTYVYDDIGQLTSVTDAAGKTESYTYDAVGNRKTLTNKNGAVWTYNYDSLDRLVEEIAPAVNVASITTAGVVSTQARFTVTSIAYDALGNVTSRTEGRLRTSIGALAANDDLSQARTTTYGYDAVGHQVSITSPGWYNKVTGAYQQAADNTTPANTFQVTTEVTYDALGNAVRNRVRVNNTGVAATDYVDSYKVYDILGRVTHDVDALKGVTAYTYDAQGNTLITKRYANALSAAVPAVGYYKLSDITATTLVANPAQDRTLTTTYDALGRKTAVQQDQVGLYTFTGVVASSSQVTAAPTTVYSYNALGQVTRETQIARNTNGTAVITGASTYYYYDLSGNRIASVDAQGNYTRVEYDNLGQMTRQVEYATALTSWVEGTLPTNPTANANDRSTRYTYDALGRLTTITLENVRYWQQSINAQTNAVSATLVTGNLIASQTTYDGVGNVLTQTDSAGNVVTTTYDAQGHVIKVVEPARATAKSGAVDPFAATAIVASPTTVYAVNAFGQVISETRAAGTDASGNLQAGLTQITRTRYDAAGYEIQEVDAGNSVVNYKVDVAGRVIEESRQTSVILSAWTVNGAALTRNQTIRRTYTFDALGQQTATTDWYTAADNTQKSTVNAVTYNRFGEVTSQLLNGSLQASFTYNQVGRVTQQQNAQGITQVDYDLAGNANRSNQIGDAAISTDDRITYTRYDLLGRALEQHLPAFEANINADTLNNVTLTLTTPIIRQTYDRWGNMLSRTDARGYVTTYTYDHNNQQLTETLPVTDILRENGTSYRAALIHEKRYDGLGRLIQEVDLVGPYTGVTTSTELRTRQHVYNAVGQLTRDVDALGYSRNYRMDSNGNRVATQDALGTVMVDSYDAMDRQITHGIIRNGAAVILQTNQYDQAGRLVGEITGATAVEETLTSVANADWTSTTTGVAGTVRYTLFDERGNIVKTRNESKIEKSYEYNEYNRKIKETDGLNNSLTWSYDAANWGRLVSRKGLGNQQYSYTYNYFGQVVGENIRTLTFSYSMPDRNYTYYGNGMLKAIVEGYDKRDAAGTIIEEITKTTTNIYDASGNQVREINSARRYLREGVVSETMWWGEVVNVKNNAANYNSAAEIRYKYDETNRLKEVKSPAGSYLLGSSVRSVLDFRGTGLGNGVFGNISALPTNTARIDSLLYNYDELGNRRRVYLDTTNQSGARKLIDDWYKYDLEGRVLVAEGYMNASGQVVAGKLGTVGKGQALSYDSVGRRLSSEQWEKNTGPSEFYQRLDYAYNDLGQVLSASTRQVTRALNADTTQAATSVAAAQLLLASNYDNRGNRLTQTDYTNGVSSKINSYSYRGDAQAASQLTYNIVSGVQKLSQASYLNEAGMFDEAGNQQSYRFVIYKTNGSINYRGDNTKTYALYDDYKEASITAKISISSTPGQTNLWYNMRGELDMVVTSGNTTSTNYFASNHDGQLLVRADSNVTKSQVNVFYQGAAIASVGNLSTPQITDTFTPISSEYPGRSPGSYVVNEGDTLARIAQSVWGDSKMWYLIADANGLDVSLPLTPGSSLKIPNVVSSTHNDATTFKPYNPDDVIGNTTPTARPIPPKPKKKKCGGIASVVMVVVAVVATVFTAGAAALALAPAGTFAAGTTIAAAGTAALTGGAGLAGIGAAVIGGAVGAAAGQLAGKSMGVVDSFSWRQVAAGGLTAGFTAGIGGLAQAGSLGNWADIAATALRNGNAGASVYAAQGVMSYATSMAASKIVGLDTSFSWRNVAASAVGATIAGYANGGSGIQNSLIRGQVSAHASALIKDKWFGGDKPDYAQVAADAFGNTLGDYLVESLRQSSAETVRYAQKLANVSGDDVHAGTVRLLLNSGATPEEVGQLYNDPDLREPFLHPTKLGEDGGFLSYEGDGVWVGVPAAEQPLSYSIDSTEGVAYRSSAGTLVDFANAATPIVHDGLMGLGRFAEANPNATRLIGLAVQGVNYALMGPMAAMRDVATQAILGPVLEQARDYAIERISDFYQSKGVVVENADILAAGTLFGVEAAIGRNQSAVDGAKQYLRNIDSGSRVRTVNSRIPINSRYAGKTIPLEDLPVEIRGKYPHSVSFTGSGFPDFSRYAIKNVRIELGGNRGIDYARADKAAGFSRSNPRPDNYTWHHHQDSGYMQLIPTDLHSAVKHTGGIATSK